MTCTEKFLEGLPERDKFYDDLNDISISDKDYDHVKRVWQEFHLKTLGDLHDL